MDGITRFGDRTAHGVASFRCAECGELAGVIRVKTPVDMGPLPGRETPSRNGLVIDYFLGTTWLASEAQVTDEVQALIDQGSTDPAALRNLNPGLAPFYCPDCELNYCAKDWDTVVLLDDGFYDCTIGTCPNGHRHTVDD